MAAAALGGRYLLALNYAVITHRPIWALEITVKLTNGTRGKSMLQPMTY